MKVVGILLISIVSSALAGHTFEIEGIGYWISDHSRNWHGAFRHCYQRGMYLIDFETFEEYQKVNQYLLNNFVPSDTYWTSGLALGTKRKSEFYWAITGLPLRFNGFGPGQPDNEARNEFCVEMDHQLGFGWNDRPCGEHKYFICRATRYFKLQQKLSDDPIHY